MSRAIRQITEGSLQTNDRKTLISSKKKKKKSFVQLKMELKKAVSQSDFLQNTFDGKFCIKASRDYKK